MLASIGTYGVQAYAVTQRRREIGVRMALGATPPQIGSIFMSAGARLLAFGTLLGCLGAWVTGRAMESILFEVSPFQLATTTVTALTIGFATLLASFVPAMRAARIDPMEALRSD